MDGDHPNLCDLSDYNMMSRSKQLLPNNIIREISAVTFPLCIFSLPGVGTWFYWHFVFIVHFVS